MTNEGLLLIASGAYVDVELAAELGSLPPALLPVGHRRLYSLQLEACRHLPGRRVLSLPETFQPSDWDIKTLAEADVEIVATPDGLLLGEAILYVLNVLRDVSGPVRLLHGDTLIHDLPPTTDIVTSGEADAAYAWGAYDAENDRYIAAAPEAGRANVLSGYFAFTDEQGLRRALTRARGQFLDGLNAYHHERRLALVATHDWLDFGHLQTFYLSRCQVRTQRAFNDLRMSFQVVEKTGEKADKIEFEAAWFETIHPPLRRFTPAYLGRNQRDGRLAYSTEYLPIPSLHELYVFGRLPADTWRRILESVFEFMSACLTERMEVPRPVIADLTWRKTLPRVAAYADQAGLDLSRSWRIQGRDLPSIAEVVSVTTDAIRLDDTSFLGVMHGDLCFSNLFYDHRRRQIRAIDPRGSVDDRNASIFGDVRYDLAKLNHSICGYDLILAGRYDIRPADYEVSLRFSDQGASALVPDLARGLTVGGLGVDSEEIAAITIQLFLSMLPLHADRPDRQRAMLENALRLFADTWGAS